MAWVPSLPKIGNRHVAAAIVQTAAQTGPPVNAVAPVISGAPYTGQTLSCDGGTWTGARPFTLTYQWKNAGSDLTGETASTYVLLVTDEGDAITCSVTATNGDGNATQASNTITPSAGPQAPSNSVAPAVTGNAFTGQTLSCSTGTWIGDATITYAYQWKRAGSNITGETSSTYVVAVADVGQSVKCAVTATNGVGSASQDSNTVTPVGIPVNSVAPAVTGTATVGQTLSCTSGTWSGSPSYAYQWKRNGSNISSATSATYLLDAADEATSIKCTVTATNLAGAGTPADSNTVGPIAAAPSFDPAAKFDLGYGLRSDITGSNGSDITSWGHTLSLTVNGTGIALPVVATVNSSKVARFTAATPCHIGNSITSEAVPFEVWMVCKFTSPVAGHKSAFFAPHPGSTIQANWAAGASAPQDVEMYAGASLTTASPTSLPSSAFHVWRFKFNSASSTVEVDGSSIASGDAGNTSSLTGFHLGSGYFGDVSSDYDVAAWGISSAIFSAGDASDALTYMTAQIP